MNNENIKEKLDHINDLIEEIDSHIINNIDDSHDYWYIRAFCDIVKDGIQNIYHLRDLFKA